MKKILRLLLTYSDKIVLAFLLLLLILTLVVQVNKYMSTIKLIEETKNIDTTTGKSKRQIPAIEESQFDIRVKIDPARTWQAPYTVGKWENLGPEVIFQHHPTPPATASKALREHLKEIGPTSLFDPAVYVYPIDRKPYLLDFASRRAYYPPYRLDYVPNRDEKSVIPVGDDDDDDDDDDKPELEALPQKPLVELVRWAPPFRPVYPNLPFILSSVIRTDPKDKATWNITVKINRGGRVSTRMLKIGSKIDQTGYVIEDVEYKEIKRKTASGMTLTEKTFTMTVSPENGQDITMEKNKVARDVNSEPFYEIVFFPRGKRTLKVKSGAAFPLRYEDERGVFRLQVNGVDLKLQRLTRDGSVIKEQPLQRYTDEALQAWQEYRRKRAQRQEQIERQRAPEAPGMPGEYDIDPGAMPGMPPPDMMP